MSWTPTAVIRLSLLGLVGGIVQLAAVSQITVFGVPADLSPLLVAAVGLLAGSIAGAAFGFSLGLFMDTTLLQTLGITSLVLIAVNLHVDLSARLAGLARRPDAARRLLSEQAEQVLFGSDAFPPDAGVYADWRRFLSALELPEHVLDAVCRQNALRLLA